MIEPKPNFFGNCLTEKSQDCGVQTAKPRIPEEFFRV